MHATAYLKNPQGHEFGPVVVLFGAERSLKQTVIQSLAEVMAGSDGEETPITRFTGKDADLASVCDELSTVSMFGDRRLVVIDSAAEFIKKNRAGVERYLEKPSKKSLLVLDVDTWPKNTKLAKKTGKIGLEIDCGQLSGRDLMQWLQQTGQETHGKQLTRDGAMLMAELAGDRLGLLEQELAKLASFVGDRQRIDVDDVRTLVGGWKAETTWTMINALRDGNLPLSLTCLEKLLVAGEAPQRILGGIVFTFRKLAQATELSRSGRNLNQALKDAGVFPRDIGPAANYLRRIGRVRAERISSCLLQTDGNLKGGSRLPDRMQLERLLVELSGVA